jgi:hypothetical protein
MKLATLIASRNRPDLVNALVAHLRRRVQIPNDIIVVECGTDADRLTPHSTLRYDDPEFRGKCFGHNLGLMFALLQGGYDYYWVLVNDLQFPGDRDPAATMIETMEAEPALAILSPTDVDGNYPCGDVRPGGAVRTVATCDYLGFLMRAQAVNEVGFLNANFTYSWGAIHEMSYLLYRSGWSIAYTDAVSYRHLGGSTYGAANTKTISRDEYQRRAKRFAHDYFLVRYGDAWDETFWEATRGHRIEVNTYREHRRLWETGFTCEELANRRTHLLSALGRDARAEAAAAAMQGAARP